jgi:hypothetical protein
MRLKSSVMRQTPRVPPAADSVYRGEAQLLRDVGVEPDDAEGALQLAGGVVDGHAVRMLDHLEQSPLSG